MNNTVITNQQAKNDTLRSIGLLTTTTHDPPSNIIQYISIIKNDVPDFLSLVVCLHLIIMFNDDQMLSNYLEEIYMRYGTPIMVKFMINYSIIGTQYLDNNDTQYIIQSNSINALTCAALWNTDPNIIRILMLHGADINSINESGQFPDEISESISYYNHLHYYIHTTETERVVYGKRSFNEFIEVNNELRRIAGEEQ